MFKEIVLTEMEYCEKCLLPDDVHNQTRSEGSVSCRSSAVKTWRSATMHGNTFLVTKSCPILSNYVMKILIFLLINPLPT